MTVRAPRYWTGEDDALLIAGLRSDEELAGLFGRSVQAVRQRRWKVTTGRASADWTMTPIRNVPEDVWKFVDKRGEDDCWPWTGARRRRGYGVFTLNSESVVAHRLVYLVATGEDPGDFLVGHKCDNPPCCNPAHLFLGSHTDNVHDMLDKGRARPPRGEAHHTAKLTVEQVREIRRRAARGEKLVVLSAEFGVSDGRLSDIVRYPDLHWSHA
jgi:hypothetical protein